ncbi:ABC transporter permease [Egibacter rhizosphaerae]|uniref:ABC transporter permease n=1 Tax=Egibacter rhizosphaerae TaxID=1670831 RepID=A0A411YG20_9ACTN|nr:ABC transporter permease [Egibacter rhizosphaerae]QBI20214.1 ABC transporter permease [Egibacter rhizosphaerae]
MTATTHSPANTERAPSNGHALAGTGTLVRFMLRRDRIRLLAWTAGFAALTLYLVTALPVAYETEADLAAATQLFADPVGRMLIGPGYGFDDPSFERFVANGYGLYFFILSALMSILLIVRHTRLEEQTGRAELVRANVVGRHTALTSALIVTVITNLVIGAAVFGVMVAVAGFGAGGSALFAASIAAVGVGFGGIATITAQLTEYSRAAAGIAGAALGAAFVLRAGGDMAAEGGNALSWTSPLGWGQQTAPFVLDRWWPLALPLGLAVVAAAVGYALAVRRDVGASLFSARPGPATAAPSLGTPLGLALRLQRASILGWGAALIIGGLVFGAYTDALIEALADMPDVFLELFGGAEDMVAGYLAYMAEFMAYLVAAFAIMAVRSLRNEETGGRAEPVLATPVSRWAWLGSNLAVAAAAVVVLMGLTGAATGAGAAIVTGEAHHVGELTAAHLNHAPGPLLVLGVAALLFGVFPRAVPIAWVLVGYGLVVGTFGPLLDLPEAAFDLSPFEHPAEMPLEGFALAPVAILTLLAIVAAALGLLAFRQRGVNVT